jgi:anti-sigma B factor antagonist
LGSEEFTLAVEHDGPGCVVRVGGELDMETAPQLDECLVGLAGQPVTLDLSALTFMDSGGLKVLVTAMKRAARNETPFTVRGVQPAQRRLLEITGLAEQLNIQDD